MGPSTKPIIYLSNDSEEQDFYTQVVGPLIFKPFRIEAHLYFRPHQQALALSFHSRQLIEYLNYKMGYLEYGSAKQIPKTIRDSTPSIKCAFLCGLFDADGALVFSLKSYGSYCYPTVEIKSVDLVIVSSTKEMLVELGFRASIRKSAESWVVSVNGKAQLERWMRLIGSYNIKHLSKYLLWKEHGSCPPYTKVAERLTSLGLDQGSFYHELVLKAGIDALSLSNAASTG